MMKSIVHQAPEKKEKSEVVNVIVTGCHIFLSDAPKKEKKKKKRMMKNSLSCAK